MKLCALAAAVLLGAGCTSTKNGTSYHWIVGFGVVRVNQTNSCAAKIISVQALGLGLNTGPAGSFTAGLASSTFISIHTNENINIEVSRLPGAPLKVNVP